MSDYFQGWSNRETWAANLYLSNDAIWHRAALDVLENNSGDFEQWFLRSARLHQSDVTAGIGDIEQVNIEELKQHLLNP